MLETKIIPLFYEADSTIAFKLIDACYEGGARVIEFTNRGDQAEKVFADMINYCKDKYPELALGIGSISSPAQVNTFVELGAHFLV